jgi:hypothetical protein
LSCEHSESNFFSKRKFREQNRESSSVSETGRSGAAGDRDGRKKK